jgi:HK97 gp10 family phage protein
MSDFNPSYEGLGQLLRSEEMKAEMLRRAEKVAAAARAIAPVDDGEYKASITASVGIQREATERAAGRVEVGVDYAIFVEYGTLQGSATSKGSPAQHVLGRALDAAKD